MDVISCLDRHLVYPVLDFLQGSGKYDEKEILKAKLDILEATNMPDHCAELYKQIHDTTDVPNAFSDRSADIEKQHAELEQESSSILEVLEKPEVAGALRQDKAQNLVFLRDSHGITIDQINVLFKFGQFDYNRGNYAGAIDHLYHFRVLSTDQKLITAATWGKLASEILTANWEEAQSELTKLKEQIDSEAGNAHAQFKNRTWLLHWSLFPLHKSGTIKAAELQDLFFSPAYMNVIQIAAPHLLRYLTVAVLIVSASRVNPQMSARRCRELSRILYSEKNHKDPLIRFALCMYSTYDFEAGSTLLSEIQDVIEDDYFMANNTTEIMKVIRVVFTENYLRLHRSSDMDTLQRLLGSSQDELVSIVSSNLEHLNADVDVEDGIIEVLRDNSHAPLQEMIHKLVERSQHSAVKLQSRYRGQRV